MSGGYLPQPPRIHRRLRTHQKPVRSVLRTRCADLSPRTDESEALEIAADAADAAQSVVLEQVSAGVAIRMAILYHQLAGEGNDE
jgi:hypothetical protein